MSVNKKKLRSNQCYALVVLVLSAVYGLLGLKIEDGFYSDPIGPALWVQGVAVCLIFLSCLLFFSGLDFVGDFPQLREWLGRLPFVVLVFSYAYLLPLIGFAITTLVLMTLVCILFNARILVAIMSSIAMTIGCYLIFSVALDISLPVGYYLR